MKQMEGFTKTATRLLLVFEISQLLRKLTVTDNGQKKQ